MITIPNYQLVILIITLILLPIVTSLSDPHFVHYECARRDNSYTTGTTFEAELNTTLLTILPTNASLTGFSTISIGEGIDELHSLFYCKGDIRGQDCHDCVQTAGRKIREHCTLIKEGIIWYEECTLRYSNRSAIFSTEEITPSFLNYNFSSTLKNLEEHRETFQNLMNSLIMQAAGSDHLGKLQSYATGESPVMISSEDMKLRGLLQCRPDMVSGSCETCLRTAVQEMDGWATTMVFLPNCNFRFDLLPSRASPRNSTGKGGGSRPQKIVIAVVVIAVVLLLCCIIICIFRGRNKGQDEQPSRVVVQVQAGNADTSVAKGDIPAKHVAEDYPTDVHHQNISFSSSQTAAVFPYQSKPNIGANNFPEPSAPPLP